MASELYTLFGGYYPGSRPVKKKKGGGKPVPYEDDPFVQQLGDVLSADRGWNVPDKVKDIMVDDIKGAFKIKFSGSGKESDLQELERYSYDQTEYDELPGLTSVSFDLNKAYEKGPEEAIKSFLQGLKNAALNRDELGAASELTHVWAPAFNPATDVHDALSLSSEVYKQKWLVYDRMVGGTLGYSVETYIPHKYERVDEYKNGKPTGKKKRVYEMEDYTAPDGTIQQRRVRDTSKPAAVQLKLTARDRTGAVVDHADNLKSVDNIRGGVRDLVYKGNSFIFRDIAMSTIKGNTVVAFQTFLEHSPNSKEAVLDAERELVRQYLKDEMDRLAALKAKADAESKKSRSYGEGKDLEGKDDANSRLNLNPVTAAKLDIASTEAKNEYETEVNKFWDSFLNNDKKEVKDANGNTVATYNVADSLNYFSGSGGESDTRIWNWAKLATYRYDTFRYTEYLDAIGSGSVFKNIIWRELYKTRLKYFTPGYYVSRAIGRVRDYALKRFIVLKSLKAGMDKLIGYIDGQFVRKGMQALATNFVMKGLAGKAAQSMMAALATGATATGVGAVPAALIAAVGYVGEKLVNFAWKSLRFQVEDALDDVYKIGVNFFKFCCFPVLGCGMILCWAVFSFIFTANRDPSTGEGGQVGMESGTYEDIPEVPEPIENPYGPTEGDVVCKMKLYGRKLPEHFGNTVVPFSTNNNAADYITTCFHPCRPAPVYLHGGLDYNWDPDHFIPLYSNYRGTQQVFYSGWGSGWLSGFGWVVVTKASGAPYYQVYAHLAGGSLAVQTGDTVQYGDLLGKIDNSGNSFGDHLHWEIRSGGTGDAYRINPCYVVGCGGVCPATWYGAKDTPSGGEGGAEPE